MTSTTPTRPNPPSAPSPPLRWFITGASGGLGRELVRAALDAGDEVIASARHAHTLSELTVTHPDRLHIERLDITDPDAVTATIARVLATHGRIDVVVNNAGYSVVGASEEMTDAQLHHQLAILLYAPIQITRAFLTPMRRQGGGRIIQISSVGGQITTPGSSAYHAGKWGLEGYTDGLAKEVAEFGIYPTIVEPGGMRTNFATNIQTTTPIDAYENGTVGAFRRQITSAGPEVYRNDPAKLARAIVATTRDPHPPLRLAFGGDAYEMIHTALTTQIHALENQRELAFSVASETETSSRGDSNP
jgi:NAD(P)-dependent dehydrogenase (short-subunit alcohol dehydrogenase family)